jgi:hypothetical protein
MSDLFTPAARNWVDDAILRHSKSLFGKLVPAVIWSDERGDAGELLVPIDPIKLVAEINKNPYILLHNHDPGRPKGQILESANFESEDGIKFIAAILGYYAGGEVLSFQNLHLDTKALTPSPKRLPVLPDGCWIELATDPREVDKAWFDLVTNGAPLQIKRTELSHNAADSVQALIRIGLPYLVVIWNPFITSIASEAGKDTYAAIHKWLRKLFSKSTDLRNPIFDIHTYQDDCQVSFLLRGNNVGQNYVAHDALPSAAAQAAQLVAKLKVLKMTAQRLIYEFDKEALKWFPSYAILNDNRILTDSCELIAIEQLPTGLSLGLNRIISD